PPETSSRRRSIAACGRALRAVRSGGAAPTTDEQLQDRLQEQRLAAKGPHNKSRAHLRSPVGAAPRCESPHHQSRAPLRSSVGAAPRCERPHTISTPETTNPPCRRVCHIKGSALQLRTGLDDGFGHIELL